jgi:hypothetical protein
MGNDDVESVWNRTQSERKPWPVSRSRFVDLLLKQARTIGVLHACTEPPCPSLSGDAAWPAIIRGARLQTRQALERQDVDGMG